MSGFTLIELMVAIGILIILVGILMFALKAIGDRAKAAETRTALANASGLLAELESKTRLGQSNAPAQWWYVATSGNPALKNLTDPDVVADSDIDFWHMTFKATSPTHPGTINAPGSVKPGESGRDGPNNYAVRNTVIAMTKLMTLPANRTKIQNLPPARLYKPSFNPPGIHGPNDDSQTDKVDESQAPVLLDGWGNPIIFVPAAGMLNVKLSGTPDPTKNLITSSKIRKTNDSNTSQQWANLSIDRPFFASAGPDGDFSTGDDNIYSFEQ